MTKIEKVLRIFLASPGDVNPERHLVYAFVSEWNNLWSDELALHLKLLRWESHAYPSAGEDGQDVINRQIGEEYDIFLGIMWKRFGTPTGRADSGTAEEFERALARYRASRSPELMFYFKKIDANTDVDVSQSQAVLQFRSRLAKEGLLYWEFSSPEQFGQLVRVHLTRYLQTWVKRHGDSIKPDQQTQNDLKRRYESYLSEVKTQSGSIQEIINQYAQVHLAYILSNRRRAVEAHAMTDSTPDLVWKLSLIEMANEMVAYADAVEKFENNFIVAFSTFVESVLAAAAVSIAFPDVKIKAPIHALTEVRKKLHPVYETTGKYIEQLTKVTPNLSGVMLTANTRIIAGHNKFREHVRFGERLLLESEKIFKTKR